MTTEFPKARSRDLVILSRPDETLVFDAASGEAHCLNETAAFVWSRCTGDRAISDIVRSVEKKFGHKVSEDFVRFALDQLMDRKLLSEDDQANRRVPNRREAIKKI